MATNRPPDRDISYNPNIISTSQVIGLVYDLIVLKLLHVSTVIIRVINGPQAESTNPLRWAISRRELLITEVLLATFFRYDTVIDDPAERDRVPGTGLENGEAGTGTGATVRGGPVPVSRAVLSPTPRNPADDIAHVVQENDLKLQDLQTAEGADGANLTPSPLVRLTSTGSTARESLGSSERLGVENELEHGVKSQVPKVEDSSFTRPILNHSASAVFDRATEATQTRSDYGGLSRHRTVNWIAQYPVTDIEAHPISLRRHHGITESQLVQERKRLKLWRSADDRFASADGLELGAMGMSDTPRRGMRIRSVTSVRPFSEV
ncbi:hypothetical protein P170DRAFT_463539 [Aspergillus steynii IBT 23096]|uniref:Uncharacterized protein n=1 Tax=Aspergillus steynii IBT 23096 TaxID=1392250 RepID=A0A2I2GBN6_9EURO|nr:uncharacterized protein P170DRAFT_463539 [Aspergillus steynii IBT 23096]PLB50299.1 hypothetical protein P170DRAFT_463539 [Aspergillus steynii IBT 23096]